MGDFKKTNVKVFARKSVTTPDVLYWKKLGVPVFLKEFGPIDYIDFSPVEPHYFAVTSSVHVQVYSPVTRLLYKNLSRFQKNAYGGSFRSDGSLLCAGGEENVVKLFNVATKSLMRVFHGHTSAVHRCFFTLDNVHIASYSDDGSVAMWDIPSEKRLTSFSEHSDYVRAGAVSPMSPDIILSGSYDMQIKMFDLRSHTTVFSVNHGAPVESVLFLPSGGIFLSAGGTEVKVWDCLAGGRLLARLNNHHKTVTCLRLGSEGRRVLSAGLDRHVAVCDVTTFNKLHTIDYPNAILSLGITANDETLAVGMVDGLVSVTRMEKEPKVGRRKRTVVQFKHTKEQRPRTADCTVGEERFNNLSIADRLLQKFKHTEALNRVLIPLTTQTAPHATVAMMQALLARHKLHNAVAGANPKTVVPLLRFLIKYIGDYRFTRVLIDASNVLLDVYEENMAECGQEAVKLFYKLQDRLQQELSLTESLLSLQGCLELMVSVSMAGVVKTTAAGCELSETMKPSHAAQNFVVNVS